MPIPTGVYEGAPKKPRKPGGIPGYTGPPIPTPVPTPTPPAPGPSGTGRRPNYDILTIPGAIQERISHFDFNTATNAPYTTAQVVMSQTQTRLVKALAAGLPQAIAYVNSDTQFAGLPGFLIRAKLLALRIPDAAARQQALGLLDNISALPADQQSQLLLLLRGNLSYARETFETATIPGGIPSIAGPTAQAPAIAGLQRILPPGADITAAGVVLPLPATEAELVRTQQLAGIIHDFFPSIPLEMLAQPNVSWFEKAIAPTIARMDKWVMAIQHEDPLLAALETAGMAWEVAWSPLTVGFAGIGEATGSIPGIGKPIRNAVGGTIRFGMARMGDLLNPVGTAAASASGYEKGTEAYDTAVEGYNAVLSLIVLHEFGRFTRSVKMARTVPEDLARATLGLDEASILRIGEISGIRDAAYLAGRGITFIDRTLSNLALKYFGMTPEEWSVSRSARAEYRVVDKLQKKYRGDPDKIAPAIMERYGEVIPEDLAQLLARTPLEEMAVTVADYMSKPGGSQYARNLSHDLTETRAARTKLEKAPPEELSLGEIARLKLKEELLIREIPLAKTRVPMFEFPNSHIMRSAMYEPVTRTERLISSMYDLTHSRRVFFNFINELPRNPILYNQFRGNLPVNWREMDISTMTRHFRDAHIPVERIRELINEKYRLKNDVELKNWYDDVYQATKDALPASTPEWLVNAITRYAPRGPEGRYRSIITVDEVDANGITRRRAQNVAERIDPATGEVTALPSRPGELINHLRLSDPDLLFEAHSVIRRGVRALERTGLAGRFATGVFYHFPRGVLQFQTALLKAPILALRLPAMIERIQLEQMLRMMQLGYSPFSLFRQGLRAELHPTAFDSPILGGARGMQIVERGYIGMPGGVLVPRYAVEALAEEARSIGLMPDPRYARFERPSVEPGGPDLGLLYQQLFEAQADHMYFEHRTSEIVRGVQNPTAADFEGWRKAITGLYEDEFTRQLAKFDLDGQRMFDWLNETDTAGNFVHASMREQVYEHLGPLYEEPVFKGDLDARIRTLIDRNAESMRQILNNGDPEMVNLVANGRWITRPADVSHLRQEFGGETVFEAYAAKVAELKGVKDILAQEGHGPRQLPGGSVEARRTMEERAISPAQRRAYQADRVRLMREVQAMEAEHGFSLADLAGDKGWVRIADEGEFRGALSRQWEEAQIEFPENIVVDRVTREGIAPAGFLGNVGEFFRKLKTLENWNRMWYSALKAVTWADVHLTRSSLYYQVCERTYRGLRTAGYTAEDATAFAEARASAVTRGVMYDLSARTTYQRALKDVFWFAPAYQEILSVWLGKIPAQYYWPVGMLKLAGQAGAMYSLFQQLGVIQKDANGTDVIAIPGFDKLVENLTGKALDVLVGQRGQHFKVPDLITMKLTGFNLVLGSFGPSLSYAPSKALAVAAREFGGVFKALSEVMLPYGLDPMMSPRTVAYGLECLGAPKNFVTAIEMFSQDYIYQVYDKSYDQAMQYAVAEMVDKGVKPPDPQDYSDTTDPLTNLPDFTPAAREKYQAAQSAYIKQVFVGADSYFHGIACTKLIGSSVTPAALYLSSADKEAFSKFWNTVFPTEQTEMTEKQYNMIDSYLADHPNSVAFHTWTTMYGTPARQLPYQSTGDQAWQDAYWTGERQVLTPEEMARALAWNQSRALYLAHLQGELRAISPSLDVPTLLKNGYARAQALNAYHDQWDTYMELNPELKAEADARARGIAEKYGEPTDANAAGRLATAYRLFNELAPMFTGEDGLRMDEYTRIRAEMGQALSENVDFGKPTTASEKQMSWYYDNVAGPFYDRVQPLLSKATAAAEQGVYAGTYWDKYRRINNAYARDVAGRTGPDGTIYPTPEEVSFGSRPPAEQQRALLNWASKPIAWLSDFQREQLGYETFPDENKFFAGITKITDGFYDYVQKKDWYPSSTDYRNAEAAKDHQIQALAKKYGPQAVAALALSDAPPYVRLAEMGYGKDSKMWGNVISATEAVIANIQKPVPGYPDGYSIRSWGQVAAAQKVWLYGLITQLRQENPAYDRLWDELSVAIPLRGYDHREGSPLYEAVLFGQFDSKYMPAEVIAAGAMPLSSGG
jgi:hypothetical protein